MINTLSMLNATDRQAVSKLFMSCSACEYLDSTTHRCDHMPARRYSNDCMNAATHAVIYKMKILFLHSDAENILRLIFFSKAFYSIVAFVVSTFLRSSSSLAAQSIWEKKIVKSAMKFCRLSNIWRDISWEYFPCVLCENAFHKIDSWSVCSLNSIFFFSTAYLSKTAYRTSL